MMRVPMMDQAAEDVSVMERRARWVGEACLLLIPPMLLHARAVAEGAIVVIDLLFLLRCVRGGGFGWLRRPELVVGLVLWAWVVLTSAVGPAPGRELPQALALLRFWIFVPALCCWLLLGQRARRRLWWVVAASAAWIGVQAWEQYLTGRNILGYPRWGDGSLTGPFFGPRAGPAFIVLLYPALLPPVMGLLGRPSGWAKLAGGALAVLGIVTLLLIGQRMPALLGLLGLLVSGLLLRRLRPAAVAALVVAGVTLAALPVVSPPTEQKLVVHFLEQMEHFWQSPYGQIYVRAAAIARAHPLLGQGFDGFRLVCDAPQYQGARAAFGLKPVVGLDEGCTIHPHQFWLQAATDGGVPALLLFGAVVVLWWRRLLRGLWAGQDALRVALFATVFDWLWPLASTSGFYNMPVSGWCFLMVGWGLALETAREA